MRLLNCCRLSCSNELNEAETDKKLLTVRSKSMTWCAGIDWERYSYSWTEKARSTFQRGNQAKINPLHTASLLSIPKSSFSKVSGIFQNPRTPSTILATSLGFNYFGNFPQYMDGALGCFILGPFLGHTKLFLWQAVLPHELEKNIKKK